MDSFLVTLLAIFAMAMYGVNKLFLWWERKQHEKLKKARYSKECCQDPTTPCQCGGECKYDVCIKDSDENL